jgi:maleylacetate reductase
VAARGYDSSAQAEENVMRSGVLAFPAIERIVYGQPAAPALREEAERLGAQHVFLIVSGTMNRTTDEIAKVRAALGSRYAGQYDRMPPHTPRDAVLEVAAAARSAGADLIVSFGGGSCTDAGKMVQLCLRHDIRAMDDFDRFRTVVKADGTRTVPSFDGPTVRQVAIPTTLSAGEFNAQSGCTDPRIKVKHNFRHPLIVPRVTIFDPAPTVHTPLWVWLSSGIRALDHATEGLCSPASSPIGDASYVPSLRLLSQALRRVKRDPADLEARLDCQLGIWLSMAGRQGGAQMGASHAIGHVLGGTCGVAHGYTSCVMLPPVLRYNRAVNAERQRLVAEAMGHPGEEAADVIAALVSELGLPGRLSEVGVGPEQFPVIAANVLHDSWLHTNPRRITSAEQVLEILEAAA